MTSSSRFLHFNFQFSAFPYPFHPRNPRFQMSIMPLCGNLEAGTLLMH